jgi:hypothetical protein
MKAVMGDPPSPRLGRLAQAVAHGVPELSALHDFIRFR